MVVAFLVGEATGTHGLLLRTTAGVCMQVCRNCCGKSRVRVVLDISASLISQLFPATHDACKQSLPPPRLYDDAVVLTSG
jgi:hypothetical protein